MSDVHDLQLDVLDPEAFPDLESVREFVGGNAFRFMMERVQEVLEVLGERVDPRDRPGLSDHVLGTAGHVAYCLSEDLLTLAQAAVRGAPIKAGYGTLDWHDERRLLLTSIAMSRISGDDRYLAELLRYLGPRPQSAWEYDHGSPAQEASQ